MEDETDIILDRDQNAIEVFYAQQGEGSGGQDLTVSILLSKMFYTFYFNYVYKVYIYRVFICLFFNYILGGC